SKNRYGAIWAQSPISFHKRDISFPQLKNSNNKLDYQELRPLDEINAPNKADAYPWISSDGLRLYFTRQGNEGDQIVFCERESLDGLFGEVQILSINRPGVDNFSCWLNQEETEIFFVARKPEDPNQSELFRAHRNSRNEAFREAQKVQLTGDFAGFFSGPSLSQNQDQLFLFNVSRILEFEQKNDLEYRLKSAIYFADTLESNPGQLSKDDLRYFTSLDIRAQEEEFFLFLERPAAETNFLSKGRLGGEVKNGPFRFNFQPSTSQKDEVIVFVSNASNLWRDNNLYLARRKSNNRFTLEAFLIDPARDTLFPLRSGTQIDMDALGLREFSLEIKTGENQPDSVKMALQG
ncbi:MAG: hypothetical protein AAFU64_20115, partial [Bacteroidota bacterium]